MKEEYQWTREELISQVKPRMKFYTYFAVILLTLLVCEFFGVSKGVSNFSRFLYNVFNLLMILNCVDAWIGLTRKKKIDDCT